jgi:Nucleotidyl transferase AbiEii toxin, Type IV TA system
MNLDLTIGNVTTVDPSRTFRDKVVILHGLRRWWDRRGELKGGGQRVSRHYYDVYRLLASEIGRQAMTDALRPKTAFATRECSSIGPTLIWHQPFPAATR